MLMSAVAVTETAKVGSTKRHIFNSVYLKKSFNQNLHTLLFLLFLISHLKC